MNVAVKLRVDPAKDLYECIPAAIVKQAGITDNETDARSFSESMFKAGAFLYGNRISRVVIDSLPVEKDYRKREIRTRERAYMKAIGRHNIKDTNNARTFGTACFWAGKRYVYNAFSGACREAVMPPY